MAKGPETTQPRRTVIWDSCHICTVSRPLWAGGGTEFSTQPSHLDMANKCPVWRFSGVTFKAWKAPFQPLNCTNWVGVLVITVSDPSY